MPAPARTGSATKRRRSIADSLETLRSLTEATHVQQRLELAVRAGQLGIWDYDLQSNTITSDVQWLRMMGLPLNEPVRTIEAFQKIIHPDDVERATNQTPQTARQLLATGQNYSIEFRIVRPGGEIRWVRSMACILEDMDGAPWRAVGFVTDITDARLAEQRLAQLNAMLEARNNELSRQAFIDPLTSIANRRRFDEELLRACAQSKRTGENLAVAMIDVDCFKDYNDHFGHAEGDRALRAVAEVIASAAWRPYDLAARYGGEEFVLILPDVSAPAVVLERIRQNVEELRLPHPKSTVAPYVTISCGGMAVERDAAPDVLLARSDEALYRAKAAGRNRVVMSAAP